MARRCIVCGETEVLERHHVSYRPERIVWLCPTCHKKVHKGLIKGIPAPSPPVGFYRKSRNPLGKSFSCEFEVNGEKVFVNFAGLIMTFVCSKGIFVVFLRDLIEDVISYVERAN